MIKNIFLRLSKICFKLARVAELVDAQDLKSCGSDTVRVRFPPRAVHENMYFVYILLLSNNKFYTGFSDDLKRRFREHVLGKVKSTKNLRPVKLIFYEMFLHKKDAQRRERYFKTTKGKKVLRIMLREYFNEWVRLAP